jgi:hypothetical protein
MRILFTTTGGLAFFPGLSMPAVIDSRDLSTTEVAELEQLLASTRFFELAGNARGAHHGAADYQQYTITVENGKRRHTVRLMDPVENPQLQMLLDLLRRHAERPATHGTGTASELTRG